MEEDNTPEQFYCESCKHIVITGQTSHCPILDKLPTLPPLIKQEKDEEGIIPIPKNQNNITPKDIRNCPACSDKFYIPK